jgi:hypothetical protein
VYFLLGFILSFKSTRRISSSCFKHGVQIYLI